MLFRITHVKNVPWILHHGVHCRNSAIKDPGFISIGSPDLIDKRANRRIEMPPGGTLADYVPFYFTSHSKMLYNIHTGWEGIIKRPNEEIAILVSSLDHLTASGVQYLYTNGHAYMKETEFFADKTGLEKIDWPLLNRRDFRNDPNDLGKSGRYQAEALAFQHVPVSALLGIACYDAASATPLVATASSMGLTVPIKPAPKLYF